MNFQKFTRFAIAAFFAVALGFGMFAISGKVNAMRIFAVYVDGIYWGTVEGELFGNTLWIWGMMANGGSIDNETAPEGSETLALDLSGQRILATDRSSYDEVLRSSLETMPDAVGRGDVNGSSGSPYKLLLFLPAGSLDTLTVDGVISKDEVYSARVMGAALVYTGEERAGVALAPAYVDGVLYDPETFNARFGGTELHSIIEATDESMIPTMRAFTDMRGLVSYSEKQGLRIAEGASLRRIDGTGKIDQLFESAPVADFSCNNSFTRLKEHKNYNGAEFTAQVGWGYSFINGFSWWNDRISSLKTAGTGTATRLYSNTGWTGSTLTAWGTCNGIKKLSNYGWNDVAGSVDVFP